MFFFMYVQVGMLIVAFLHQIFKMSTTTENRKFYSPVYTLAVTVYEIDALDITLGLEEM